MVRFRVLSMSLWLMPLGYTGMVIAMQGLGLLPIFADAIAPIAWPGQFDIDFTCFWRGCVVAAVPDRAALPVRAATS